MRSILSILLICVTAFGYSQSIKPGIYYNKKKDIGFEADIFNFKDNQKFTYVFLTCTGMGVGTGSYEVIADSLILQFEDNSKFTLLQELKFTTSKEDSLSIHLTVLEEEGGYPLPGTNVYFPEEKIGWQTDMEGKMSGTIQKKGAERTLRIQYLGFGPIDIAIPPNTSVLSGTLRLTELWFYNSKDRFSFELLRGGTRFKLARYKSGSITYRKITKERALEMLQYRTKKLDWLFY